MTKDPIHLLTFCQKRMWFPANGYQVGRLKTADQSLELLFFVFKITLVLYNKAWN